MTISTDAPSVQTRVLGSSVPGRGCGTFNLGDKGCRGGQTFLGVSRNKREDVLTWGRAGDEEGTGSGFFSLLNLWTNPIAPV